MLKKILQYSVISSLLILTANYSQAQNLTKAQTLDYILAKSNYKVTIDDVGNININEKAKFHYSNIILNRQNDTELEFRCKLEKGNCIDSKEAERAIFSYKIKVDKEVQANIYNAFDYLLVSLSKEKPELTNDPFSPHNYKKKQ